MLIHLCLGVACGRAEPGIDTGPRIPDAAPAASTPATSPQHVAPIVSAPPEARWILPGTESDRLARVAKHLRGLDVAMIEVGYRYAELFWAGRDGNWEHADYQLGKIQLSIDNALERRPKRQASAEVFAPAYAEMRAAIGTRDASHFERAFASLTSRCNACHVAERVGYMRVAPPSVRSSVIVGPLVTAPRSP